MNMITDKPETWLVCISGFAACKVCRSYTGHGRKDSLAQGTGSCLKFQNILRHGNLTKDQQQKLKKKYGPQQGINWTHELAIQQWCQRMSLNLEPDLAHSVVGAAGQDISHRFIYLRTLLETRGSFSSLDSWVVASKLGHSDDQKLSVESVQNSLHTMASYEQFTTRMLVRTGLCSASRLMAEIVCTKWRSGRFCGSSRWLCNITKKTLNRVAVSAA